MSILKSTRAITRVNEQNVKAWRSNVKKLLEIHCIISYNQKITWTSIRKGMNFKKTGIETMSMADKENENSIKRINQKQLKQDDSRDLMRLVVNPEDHK